MNIEELEAAYPNAITKIKAFVKRCPVCKSIELPKLSFWKKEYFTQEFLDENEGGEDEILIVVECNCPNDQRYVTVKKINKQDLDEYEKQAQSNVPEHQRIDFW